MESIEKGELDVSIPVLSNDEIGAMSEGFNRMAEGLRERDYILETFGRYISEEVVEEILHSPEGIKMGGELRNITILVSDLRGFTPIAESLDPQSVLETLNRYFESMTDVIVRHRGTIDEFTGDGILVFFGAPRPAQDHALRAVACALDMQKALRSVNIENARVGRPELRMGIGINTGELIVGNIGSEKRRKYGAVGSPINVAFRVETHASGGEILLTPSVYEQVGDRLKVNGTTEAHLKGFERPITLYSVVSMM
jgi:adenylate cyclase